MLQLKTNAFQTEQIHFKHKYIPHKKKNSKHKYIPKWINTFPIRIKIHSKLDNYYHALISILWSLIIIKQWSFFTTTNILSYKNHLQPIRELFAVFPHKWSFSFRLHPADDFIVRIKKIAENMLIMVKLGKWQCTVISIIILTIKTQKPKDENKRQQSTNDED